MLSRILIPLDGSALSQTALDFAERIVNTQCEIILLMAVQESDIPAYDPNPRMNLNPEYNVLGNALETAKRQLGEAADALREHGYPTTICVEVGDPAQVIIHVANSLNVDLIIMSTHGRTGIDRLLHGSVTGQVLGGASQPVLVVGNQKHQRTPRLENMAVNLVGVI
ncbi:MAG: putative universal stress protein [Chloroflexi bacterium OLB15]|nr:MAG: putative universal stress protein [Chloroflexi bacterium OLB15]